MFKININYDRFTGVLISVIVFTVFWIVKPLSGEPLHEINEPKEKGGNVVAITGVRLIDGRGGSPIPDATVVVHGNRIQKVGSSDKVSVPDTAEVVEANNHSLLPGLIDSHFHSVNDNEILSRFLSNGVTSLRDPGIPFRSYQGLKVAEQMMPRVFLVGGHLDGYPPVHSQQAVIVRNERHARRAVAKHVSRGASGIKIYYRLPLKYYDEVVEAAHGLGVPVMVHLELVDADDAIRAGVDGIEHVSSFTTALAGKTASRDFKETVRNDKRARLTKRFKVWADIDLQNERTSDLVALMVEHDVVLSPTLAYLHEWVRRSEGDVKKMRKTAFSKMLRFVEMCHEAGVSVVVGSHTVSEMWGTFPEEKVGKSFQMEMEMLQRAGLSSMEIIQGATLENARYFRTEDRLGSVEPGKLADLVLVKGNPIQDLQAMYQVKRVMLNGRWVDDRRRK